MARGVPKGYRHNWKYKGHWRERKTGRGKWDVDFTARKSRKGSGRGGLPVGSEVTWKIEGYQTARKVSGRTYATRYRARKRLVGVKTPKRRKR